jgi:RNase P subunit RPR2
MKRDFNRVRRPRGNQEPLEFKDIVCPHCDYSTQGRNCRREVITTKLHITKRTYCPNCNEIINEVVEDTKTIERMKLVEDFTNTSKVSDNDVGVFVLKMQEHRGYAEGWMTYIAKAYNKDETFKEGVKLLYNRYEAELINIDTATNNIMKLKDTLNL